MSHPGELALTLHRLWARTEPCGWPAGTTLWAPGWRCTEPFGHQGEHAQRDAAGSVLRHAEGFV